MSERLKKLLFKKTKKELTEEELKKIERECIFCKEIIAVGCGTPIVKWGGCCVGVLTPTTRHMMTKKAHSHCFLKHLEKEKLIKILYEEDA